MTNYLTQTIYLNTTEADPEYDSCADAWTNEDPWLTVNYAVGYDVIQAAQLWIPWMDFRIRARVGLLLRDNLRPPR
jgi:hypothetical protein